MPAPTYTQMLETARQAYSDILTGKIQSYTTHTGFSVTKLNLDELLKNIEWLEGMAARETGVRRAAVVRFGRPS